MNKHALLATSLAVLMGTAAGVATAQTVTGPNGETISSTGPGSSSGSVEPNSPMARGTFAADGSTARPEDLAASSSSNLNNSSTYGTTTDQPSTSTYGTPAEQPTGSTYGSQPQPDTATTPQGSDLSAPVDATTPATSPQGTIEPGTAPAPTR